MSDVTDVSSHTSEEIADPPDGWVGGDLAHTGGEIYVREWVQPERGLRVSYSVTEPDSVTVEGVELFDGADATNPLNWRFVDSREERQCSDEDECLKTAIRLMSEYSPADSR